jgi:hypothetical protein
MANDRRRYDRGALTNPVTARDFKFETRSQYFKRTAGENQIQVNFRAEVPGEEEAIERALRYGNRQQRRSRGGVPGVQRKWTTSMKNKRNAKNRIARKQRTR